jgi:hypothetical protein
VVPPRQDGLDWGDQQTEQLPAVPRHRAPDKPPRSPNHKKKRWPWLLPAVLFGLLALVYVGDLVLSSGKIPRGTEVSGIEFGGMSYL